MRRGEIKKRVSEVLETFGGLGFIQIMRQNGNHVLLQYGSLLEMAQAIDELPFY